MGFEDLRPQNDAKDFQFVWTARPDDSLVEDQLVECDVSFQGIPNSL
jgi:hypothetical protein